MNEVTRELLALGLVPGLPAATVAEMVRDVVREGADPATITRMPDNRLTRYRMQRKARTSLRAMKPYREEAEEQIARAEEFGATIITLADEAYPASLREIWSPPVALFVRGELRESDADAVAIVGTRGGTTYGRIATERYAGAIASAGVTVVSGLARGVDTWAHREAMRVGGRTIAVVASGLDRIQPQHAELLAAEIAGSGAVITEYRFGVRALRPYFPQRNRIISGLSVGTLLVESDIKGGGMITARYALDQNREVFALPGPITSPKSAGPNELIRTDRAQLTADPADLLESLGFRLGLPQEREPVVPDLTIFEQKVHDLLGAEPRHVDDLVESAAMSPHDLLVTLLSLEFKGVVRQMAGKRFLRA